SEAALSELTLSPEGLMSDLHGSAAYRAHLVKVMTGRAVAAAG
ncbi:MAG: FAD binding domain-containing protein, partial [Pseudooceanicola nanhaiensis]